MAREDIKQRGPATTWFISNPFEVDRAEFAGISLAGRFINNDSVLIRDSGSYGITGRDTLINNEVGVIFITAPTVSITTGVRCSNCRIDNGGLIHIDSVDLNAIQLSSNTPDTYLFKNNNTGRIIINNLGGGGISLGDNTNFTNDGLVEIIKANAGIFNSGVLINNDSIIIREITDIGMNNLHSFHNEIGSFLEISDCEVGIMLSSQFINNDSIIVEGARYHGVFCLDSLYNNQGAFLSVSNISPSNGDAINCSNCTLFNDGHLTVDSAENHGIHLFYTPDNSNFIINRSTGKIEINEIGLNGLRIGRTSVFENEDGSLLQISNTEFSPLFIETQAIFTGQAEIIIQSNEEGN